MADIARTGLVPHPEGEVRDQPVTGMPGDRRRRDRDALRRTAAYVGQRLLGAAVSLLAVIFTSFFLFRIIPGDPVRVMTHGRPVSIEQKEALAREFGLDKPLLEQFGSYLLGVLRFDFGESFQYNRPVLTMVGERLWPTLLLVGASLVALGRARAVARRAGGVAARQRGRPGQHRRGADAVVGTELLAGPDPHRGVRLGARVVPDVGHEDPWGGRVGGRPRRRAPHGAAAGHPRRRGLRAVPHGDALLAARRDGVRLPRDGAREGTA